MRATNAQRDPAAHPRPSPPRAGSSLPGRSPWRPGSRAARAGSGVALVLLAALTALVWSTVHDTALTLRHTGPLYLRHAGAWLLFAAGAWLVRRLPVRSAVLLVAAGGVLLPLAALAGPPQTSDDSYRYAWDGRVQAAGISPYHYPPAAPELAGLRDPWLFPTRTACSAWDLHAVPAGPDSAPGCTRINRPLVPTIYPPVAQGYFALLHHLAPGGARHKTFQGGGAVVAAATTGALLWALRRTKRDLRHAVFWAWCPTVAFEAVNNAHVDTLGVLLSVVGLAVTAGRRYPAGGALLGAAVATKLLPVLVLPGAVRRHPVRVAVAAAGVFVLSYLPYVAASGPRVIGYLPGYLTEEGYQEGAGQRFGVLRLVVPDSLALYAAVAVLAATVLLVLRRAPAERPWSGALLMTGTAMLVLTPGYPWYTLLVVGLVALDGRWEWLGVPVAAGAAYLAHGAGLGTTGVQQAAYTAATVLVLAGAVLRRAVGGVRT